MSRTVRFDHIGITVRDLEAATTFFVGLRLEIEGRTSVSGDFIDTVIGIPGSSTEIVMLGTSDGETSVELSSFVHPVPGPVPDPAPASALGLRSLALEVDDLRGEVDRLADEGYGLVGGIGRFEDEWLMAYVRGPEGIIVALAERLA